MFGDTSDGAISYIPLTIMTPLKAKKKHKSQLIYGFVSIGAFENEGMTLSFKNIGCDVKRIIGTF